MNQIGDLKDKNILFLQGPMGTFFKRLDKLFRKKGALTYKIALNAADKFFSNHDNVVSYKDTPKNWEKFIYEFLRERKIDKVFIFGDCRFYQKITIKAAEKLGIGIFIFEEGYVRPNYITLEKHGVNNNSKIPRSRSFYDGLPDVETQPIERNMHNSFAKVVISAISYYIIANIFSFLYPHYIHHRNFGAVSEAFYGIRNGMRKLIYAQKDKSFNERLRGELSKKYFFVPLQTSSDFQLKKHSSFINIEGFIKETLTSFSAFAPKDTFIVFKHHPIDRGRKNYTRYITDLAIELGVDDRVVALFEINIPNALKNALGTITINSTVGLSSLYHGIPTITLGQAIYDISGLTCKNGLNNFWQNLTPPESNLFKKFRAFLITNSQINSNFYGEMGDLEKI
jgi:capsular polysaccharide export protein